MEGIILVVIGYMIFCVAGTDPQYELSKQKEKELNRKIELLMIKAKEMEDIK